MDTKKTPSLGPVPPIPFVMVVAVVVCVEVLGQFCYPSDSVTGPKAGS